MKTIIAIGATLLFIGWSAARMACGIAFDRNCAEYLKRAADANTVELAEANLGKAIQYAKDNGLTSGFTSVLYRTPSEDIGFWYTNLAASAEELHRLSPDASQLERTNVLMKLRETLLDRGDSGDSVTAPGGISVYPSNPGFALWGWGSLIVMCVAWIGVSIEYC